MADSTERIDKILSNNGYGTRKDVKKILHAKAVTVNGKTVCDASFHVNPVSDEIIVDGVRLNVRRFVYLMMNKCRDVVSANKDGEHQTVFDLLSDEYRTGKTLNDLHTVGRLDIDTEGLLLLTTDGNLTHSIISPKSNITKTYLVFLENKMSEEAQKQCELKFKNGIHIPAEDNDPEADCESSIVKFLTAEKAFQLAGKGAWIFDDKKNLQRESFEKNFTGDFALLAIHEGKYHQVKRMFRAVGNTVIYLKRMSIGSLELDSSLMPGQYRELTEEEVKKTLVNSAEY